MADIFQKAYRQLNTQQQAAVDTIEGPVLVVAGPGTGKTQLLSLRVANILQRTDANPASILCLTFTNFAATNMRERLQGIIGTAATRVQVHTFHSFAADIMSRNPDYFWHGAKLTIAPDTVQLDIVQSLLTRLPLEHPLASKFSGQFTALPDVQQALKLTKEAGLTPGKLSAMIAVNSAYIDIIEPLLADIFSSSLSIRQLPELAQAVEALPDQPITNDITPLLSLSKVLKDSFSAAVSTDLKTGKTTEAGKWKRRWLQTVDGSKVMLDERKRNAWWQAFCDVYEAYRDALHSRGYYDYSDMIVEVISQLEQQPDLRASLQEQFLYILIDEFQDTNAAQLRLAHLLASRDNILTAPNLMAVGDDDQSIFAFNGAELNNMLTFRRTYPETQLIVLTENYRSTQAILDKATSIIEQASDRLVSRESAINKQLLARSSLAEGEISHTQYPTKAHQLTAIAHRVQETFSASTTGSVAVLARNHASLREISSILNRLEVPIRYEQQNNILDLDVVQQLYLISDTVLAISEGAVTIVNANLAKLLVHPMWGLEPTVLWKLATENYANPNWLRSLIDHTNEHVANIGRWLQWLSGEVSIESLPIMLEYIIGLRASQHLTSPLRHYYLETTEVTNLYLDALAGVHIIIGLAKEFAVTDQSRLEDLVHFIYLNKSLGRSVVDQSWFVTGERTVDVMTVHKAKGLEFDTVFLLDAIDDAWKPRSFGRKPPANLPMQIYGEHYDDYVRLLYVAATRAKQSLIISSYATNEQGKDVVATPLLTDIIAPQIPASEILPATLEVLENAVKWPSLTSSDEHFLLEDRLQKFVLSATGLCQFLDVTSGGPQAFKERHLLRLPSILTPQLAYGTALHYALQVAQRLTTQGYFNLSEVQDAYESSLREQPIHPHEKDRFVPFGKQVIAALFTTLGYRLPLDGASEVSIGPLAVGSSRLRGTLDHVTQHDGQVIITDYKTGQPLASFQTKDQTKLLKAWRHRTQLTFYALLAREELHATDIVTRIAYVEAEKASQLLVAYIPDKADLEQMERLAAIVWEHIIQLQFPDTSSYPPTAQGIALFTDDLLAGNI